MKKGILMSHSAGNSGSDVSTTSSVAPWLFSVAPTTIDRKFISNLLLGNGKNFIGSSVSTFPSNDTKIPIAEGIFSDDLDKTLVKGKKIISGAYGIVSNVSLNDMAFVSVNMQQNKCNNIHKQLSVGNAWQNKGITEPIAEFGSQKVQHVMVSHLNCHLPTTASYLAPKPNEEHVINKTSKPNPVKVNLL
ncbi:subtilisin-like protease SBT4.8 [Lathyrus oleraceus]|uniref:subtilisin-like protease SBT4.8 n=1 Tax=Pisum sativum TaxID=3888 RepID=UPI0021CE639D|nr:subtilisin-like protease SBT4.8 [Pisum sativum]